MIAVQNENNRTSKCGRNSSWQRNDRWSAMVDDCLWNVLNFLDEFVKTVASCCGHERYVPTIIAERKDSSHFELFTGLEIPRKKKFYKKDKNGFYYIPEVEEYYAKIT